ncbi:hypothetical protein GCM10027059_43650 [Myceligenerans halotolerans]
MSRRADPVTAGFMLERGLAGGFIGVVVVGCLSIAGLALALRRQVTKKEDGLQSDPEPATEL